MGIENIFLQSVIKRFTHQQTLANKAFKQLDEKDFFFKPSTVSNSIAVIIQHMHGNMLSRWTNFLSEDGEKEWRKHNDELNTQ